MSQDRDLSALPEWAFGHRMLIWWGTMGFMFIEGLGFVMLFAAYGFLASQNADWPMVHVLPAPALGAALALLLLASEIPNTWLKRAIHARDRAKVQRGMVLMSLAGLAALGIRAFEFQALNVGWDANAFGSIVWALLLTHTLHLAADVAETIVMTVMCHTRPLTGARYVDLSEDCEYWDFVTVTWLPVYAVIYWAPRWMAA